jgi:hypothetical protein
MSLYNIPTGMMLEIDIRYYRSRWIVHHDKTPSVRSYYTLREWFSYSRAHKFYYILDIKRADTNDLHKIFSELRAILPPVLRVVFQSFHFDYLEYLYRDGWEELSVLLAGRVPVQHLPVTRYVAFDSQEVDDDTIKTYHDAGRIVILYNVKSLKDYVRQILRYPLVSIFIVAIHLFPFHATPIP